MTSLRIGFLIGVLSMILPNLGNAQYIDQKLLSLFDAQTKNFEDGSSINYRLLIPDSVQSGKKFPLVLFLHGAGERGNDNLSQLKWGAQEFAKPYRRTQFPAFVVAPQCPTNERWSNLDWDLENPTLPDSISPNMQKLKWLTDYLIEDLPIDTNRIYITGLSMGGYGAYDALMRWPDRWTAAAIVCGGSDKSKIKSIAHIPMWIFHGAKDDIVLPRYSREVFEIINPLNKNSRYTEYPYIAHFSWQPAYATEELYEWLFSFTGVRPEKQEPKTN